MQFDRMKFHRPVSTSKMHTYTKNVQMNLKSALRPLQRVSQVLGLNLSNLLGRIYTWFIFMTFFAITYGGSSQLCSLDCGKNAIDSFVIWIQFAANTVLALTVITCSLFKPHQYGFPHQDLAPIDKVLESFGARLTNNRLFWTEMFQIVLIVAVPLLFGFQDIRKSIQLKSFYYSLYWLHYYYSVSVSIVTDCLFVNYLNIIRERFQQLNKLMTLIEKEKLPLTITFLGISDSDIFCGQYKGDVISKIQKFRSLHHDLYTLSIKVNVNFGIQLLVNSTISLVITTGQLYESYLNFIDNRLNVEQIMYNTLWTFFYVFRLIYVSHACNRTKNEARYTSSLLYKFSMKSKLQDLRNEVIHFSLQLIHENVTFTACGFFDIDFRMLCSIIGTVTTYLVILIQMDLSRIELTSTTSHLPSTRKFCSSSPNASRDFV
uniref:Gustatory receptor n=1 Tax=Sirex noctilio TaxID=36765 RepID=A0A857NDV2_9HYME|nr:gustatory receptor 4 [Sirex noctilio]